MRHSFDWDRKDFGKLSFIVFLHLFDLVVDCFDESGDVMNHLLIGLGGTGGKIIRALRCQIRSEHRNGDAVEAKLAYLYVDASAEMMAPVDPSWMDRGTSPPLPPVDQLKIGGRDLLSRLDSLDFSGIKPWIGDKDVWADILGSVAGGSLSGQKRRLGRFLFACHVDQFRTRVQSQVGELQKGCSAAVTFHVVASLAGGTGGGSIVDAVAQLRAMYEDPSDYRILLYLLLPEALPDPGWDVGNYHANGYAALAELNAMAVSALQPWDVTGGGERLTQDDPFTGAYLFSHDKENGDRAGVAGELPSIAADFLFQKIIVAEKAGRNPLERMERLENEEGPAELSPVTRRAERSRRFLSFGIKRLAIPEQEIADYLSFSFAEQAIEQLRFNNWQDGAGFIDRPRDADLAAFVRQPDVRGRWRIGDQHLTLSTAILPADDPGKRWKPIAEEWSAVMAPIKSFVQDQKRSTWFGEVARLVERRFDEDYRGSGVEAFYRAKLGAKQEMAREIRLLIERELFSDWRRGLRSITEVGAIIDAVMEDLTRRQARCDSDAERQLRASRDYAEMVEEIAQKSAQAGALSKAMFGRSQQLLDDYADHLAGERTAQTRALAYGFAKELISDILAELRELKAATDILLEELAAALTRVQVEIDDRARETLDDDQPPFARLYDPRAVRATVRKLSLDERIQRTQTAALRHSIADRLGDGRMFAAFRQSLRGTVLADLILINAEASALHAHQTSMAGTRDRILGFSIVEKLQERYGADQPALDAFAADLVGHAGLLLRLDPLEIEKAKPGYSAGGQPYGTKLIISLPRAPAHEPFAAMLKQAFARLSPDDVEFIETPQREHEITVMSVRNLFPARHAAIVSALRDRYRHRIAENPRRYAQELHTEGDGSQLPDLFATTYQVIDGGKQAIRQLRGN